MGTSEGASELSELLDFLVGLGLCCGVRSPDPCCWSLPEKGTEVVLGTATTPGTPTLSVLIPKHEAR